MKPDELEISADVSEQLQPHGVNALAAALHPGTRGDCQTCVRPLGPKPVLRVDVAESYAIASLHHRKCRRSAWNATGKIVFNPGHVTTYSMSKWKIGMETSGDVPDVGKVLVMLNPRLELARLEHHPVFGWRPAHDPRFKAAGLARMNPDADPVPVKGITAFAENGSLKIRMRDDMSVLPRPGDEHKDPAEILDAARDGAVYLFVTHTTDPDFIGTDIAELTRVIHDPGTVCGQLTFR